MTSTAPIVKDLREIIALVAWLANELEQQPQGRELTDKLVELCGVADRLKHMSSEWLNVALVNRLAQRIIMERAPADAPAEEAAK
jgi:hypothetical protein